MKKFEENKNFGVYSEMKRKILDTNIPHSMLDPAEAILRTMRNQDLSDVSFDDLAERVLSDCGLTSQEIYGTVRAKLYEETVKLGNDGILILNDGVVIDGVNVRHYSMSGGWIDFMVRRPPRRQSSSSIGALIDHCDRDHLRQQFKLSVTIKGQEVPLVNLVRFHNRWRTKGIPGSMISMQVGTVDLTRQEGCQLIEMLNEVDEEAERIDTMRA